MSNNSFLAMLLVGFSMVTTADEKAATVTPTPGKFQTAIFAGGCFWCMEPPFAKQEGVIEVSSGYTGGLKLDPTYEEVSAGNTGHAEAVQITFDPTKITYEKLLDIFWKSADPTDAGGQFVDRGNQYRHAIFYRSNTQKQLAETSKDNLQTSGPFKNKKIVTEITAASTFYAAEEYHQHYWKKNPIRYKYYRLRSGRDEFLNKIWGKVR